MITRIEVRNFGPFGDSTHTLTLGQETLIVGPNNAGKSTFLAAYALASNLSFSPPLTKYRSYEEAAFGHKPNSQIQIEVFGKFGDQNASRRIFIGPSPPPRLGGWLNSGGVFFHGNDGDGGTANSLAQSMSGTWYLMSNRAFIPMTQQLPDNAQSVLNPQGGNVVPFLLERWTSRDPQWPEAEQWLKKIDPNMRMLKSPLRGQGASVETTTRVGESEFDVNISLQGGGIQRALQIVSAVVFSPRGTVLIIEEPEMNLHKESQEVLIDLFNKAVTQWDKQIIATTHSWDMILPFISDLGAGSKRGEEHMKADASKFKMAKLSRKGNDIAVEDYNIAKEFRQIKEDFKIMWG